jgi:hypothetical protein
VANRTRALHPREEPYRWAIERLDEAFGPDRVRITPRQHHHVIRVTVAGDSGDRNEEITLRSPTEDFNKQKDREAALGRWIAEVRKREKSSEAGARKGSGKG